MRLSGMQLQLKSFRKALLGIAWTVVVGALPLCGQQAESVPAWVTAAGGHAEFDAASVREDPTGKYKGPPFSIDADDDFANAGGLFTADLSPKEYIAFAYKLPQQYNPISHLPDWAKSKHFEITARAPAGTTKDQMRLMMQTLLAERFRLAIHFEAQDTPVLIMTLLKPGKLGPRLRMHKDGPACDVLFRVRPVRPQPSTCFRAIYTWGSIEPENGIWLGRGTRRWSRWCFHFQRGAYEADRGPDGDCGKIDFSMEYTAGAAGRTSQRGRAGDVPGRR